MKFANEHATMIATDDGRCIPADPANADYAALVAAGAAVEPYVAPLPPPPTVEDVRAEASRRMQHVVGARDAAHLQIVIANAERDAALALVSATNSSTARDGLVSAIERHVDSVAREREFDNAADAASYVNSTVAQWAAEAAAFVAWRDAVWIHTYAELEKVEAGQRAPTVAALTAELSSIAWPA